MAIADPTVQAPRYDRKLAEVLSVAAQVFAEHGYDRASIRDVAEKAGFSIAGLYYYVRSKEELLFLIQYQVFDELVKRYREVSPALEDPEDRLHLLIRNHLEHFLGNMAELVVCSREIDRLRGELRNRLEAKRREYFRLALRIFEDLAGREAGTSVEPRMATLAMFGTINWVHTWYRPGSGSSPSRMAEDFVRLYLRGLLPREASSGKPLPAARKPAAPRETRRGKGERHV